MEPKSEVIWPAQPSHCSELVSHTNGARMKKNLMIEQNNIFYSFDIFEAILS